MVIRDIKPEDNPQLAKIIKAVFEELHAPLVDTVYDDPRTNSLYEQFDGCASRYYVVEDEGEVLGGCGYYPTEGLPAGYAELVKFYFAPKLRGRGVGSQIFGKVIGEARIAGYTHLYIESFPEFAVAVSLYKKHGFVPLPNRLGHSGHFGTSIHMVKELKK